LTSIDNIKLLATSSIKEALKIIDSGAMRIALVVDDENKLLGTISDGDIRRAILEDKQLESEIGNIYNKKPIVATINDTKEDIINLCTSKNIYQIPVVDDKGRVVTVEVLDKLLKVEKYDNKVVLMVGGLGTRLKPLTDTTPKPMLPVGGKPILQTIVEKFASYGFVNIIMCIGYKSEVIQDFFGDGSKFGVNIEYVLESKRMGTAGALSLLNKKQKPKEAFFVMNGDLLTNVNFEHLLDFHVSNDAMATMCVREYDFQVPYGVVDIKDGQIKAIEEKPLHKFFVSAGIYMLDALNLEHISKNEFYDMPTLFEKLIEMDENTLSFPLREYWLDIGQMDEYDKANKEYHEVF
jgi:dTDP-glucose pyrophosphorylase